MKISDSHLRNKLQNYVKSDKFQKEFKQSNQPVKNEWLWTLANIENEISKLKATVAKSVIKLTRRDFSGVSYFEGITPNNMITHEITNIKYFPGDQRYILSCQVKLRFDPELIKRKSFEPGKSVYNIIGLLTNGWDFRKKTISPLYGAGVRKWARYHGKLKGTWRGKKNVPNLSYRPSNPILFKTIDRYNSQKVNSYQSIAAYLDSKYTAASGITRNEFISVWRTAGGYEEWFDDITRGIGVIRFGTRSKR